MMTLWCMFRSPLMLGCELTMLDEWTKSLLTNQKLLSLMKDGRHGRQIARDNEHAVWVNESDNGGAVCVALFNLKDVEMNLVENLKELTAGIKEDKEYTLCELWEGTALQTVNQAFEVSVAPHGVKVFFVS